MATTPKVPCIEHGKSEDRTTSVSQTESRDSSSNMEREYEFFVTTEEPHQPEGADRGRIRRLVMRNFFESRAIGSQDTSSEQSSATTVLAQKELRNRFRLSKATEEERKPQDEKKKGKGKEQRHIKDRPKTARMLSGSTDDTRVRTATTKTGKRKKELPKESGGSSREVRKVGLREDKRQTLKANPRTHLFDPFDVLPIPGSPQLDTLFKLCKFHRSMISMSAY